MSDYDPDYALVFERLAGLSSDLRETRGDLARLEDAIARAASRLHDLSATVDDHRRKAVEGLAVLERELADVAQVAAQDAGSLGLRVQALEEGLGEVRRLQRQDIIATTAGFDQLGRRVRSLETALADPRKLVAARTPPPDAAGVGEARAVPGLPPAADADEGE